MCLLHSSTALFNESRANQFADHLIGTLNHGALCLMLSLGHRTGLFDVMAELDAASSQEIADKAGLNERYVREWLAATVTGRVVEYDPDNKTYVLPREHAAFLSRKANADNVAVFAQYIGLMGSVEDDVLECFYNGGGVPYEKYPRFHEVMAEDSGQTVLASLEDHILPLVPGLKEKLRQGIEVLDVGCGRGRALIQLAASYPNSRFTGLDLSPEAITYARTTARQRNLNNVTFQSRDVSDFDQTAPTGQFDLITTFDAIHDQARPLTVLKGIYKALKADGTYLMQDIHAATDVSGNLEHPVGTLLYSLSTMHCMTVSLAQGGEGLGTMWGREKATELLGKAGFDQLRIEQLAHDFQNDYYIINK